MMRSLLPPTVFVALFGVSCIESWKGVDGDGDGFSVAQGDCWDSASSPDGSTLSGADIFPGAEDAPYDGIDADCAGNDDYDLDGDGWVKAEDHVGKTTLGLPESGNHEGSGDCWNDPDRAHDFDAFEHGMIFTNVTGDQVGPAAVYPGADDPWYDGPDQDCAGNSDFDQDEDGFNTDKLADQYGELGGDCVDLHPDDNPDANLGNLDADEIHSGATELLYDGTDQDCSGVYSSVNPDIVADCDADDDGAPVANTADVEDDSPCLSYSELPDCNDEDARAVPDPDVEEIFYNGVDDNCSPETEAGVSDVDGDADRDGYWDIDYFGRVPTPDGSVDTSEADFSDCWDNPDERPDGFTGDPVYAFDPHADPDDTATWTVLFEPGSLTAGDVNPSALDRPYDSVDQDCAGDATLDNEYDWDGDGDRTQVQQYTDASTGNLVSGGDCMDCSADCDGVVEGDDWYALCVNLCDNDAYLDIGSNGYINPAGLASEAVYPSATETWYDGTDQDCGRDIDYDQDQDRVPPNESDAVSITNQGESRLSYYDWDNASSEYPDGTESPPEVDCNDTDATISPRLTADDVWYDGVDTDCEGNDDFDQDYDSYVIDANVGQETYQSRTADSDYYVTTSTQGDDCIDTDATYNPAAADTWYDGFDNDCADNDDYDQDYDGVASEAERTNYGDTFHGGDVAVTGTLSTDDCDDTDGTITPGAASETWYDGIDQNCDEKDDWDADEDGHALTGTSVAYGPTVNESGNIPGTGSLSVDDCNDEDSAVYTGATDTWYDGIDNDCEGNDDFDADDDTYASLAEASDYDATYQSTTFDSSYILSSTGSAATTDCNDEEDVIHPGATDTWFDNVDQDCDNEDDFDQDYDSYVTDAYVGELTYQSAVLDSAYRLSASGNLPGDDCVEGDATYNPEATDTWYDSFDNDCADNDDWDADEDEHALEGTTLAYAVTTHAGTTVSGTGSLSVDDCNDEDNAVYTGATDTWYDGVDNDCDEEDDYDQDYDGYASLEESASYGDTYQSTTFDSSYVVSTTGSLSTDDCNDYDDAINTGVSTAEVWYDGIDNDCDGADDYDADDDGFVPTEYVGLSTYQSSSSSLAYLVSGTGSLPGDDCVDSDAAYNPSATDTWYDSFDHDCADNDDWDADDDEHAAEGTTVAYGDTFHATAVVVGTGDLSVDDCNDEDEQVYTGATDAWYDGVDSDCDDADDYDRDADSYASLDQASSYGDTYQSTTFDSSYTVSGTGGLSTTDCNDEEAVINPAAADTWQDGIDHDCGNEDDYDPDADGYVEDTYVGDVTYQSATGDTDYLLSSTGSLPGDDCVEFDSAYNPAATDTWYDGFDNDCADNDDWDRDLDGHAAEGTSVAYGTTFHASTAVSGTGGLSVDDCNDTDNAVYTGATDSWYDGVDNDCDEADDFDRDSDGYASDAHSYSSTYQSTTFDSSYILSSTGSLSADDCNDKEAVVNPGATDTWQDGTDHDCGGEDDYDIDSDGYVEDAYVGEVTYQSAVDDNDYLLSGTGGLPGDDCVEGNSAYNPTATDTWYDSFDNDCDDNDDWDADADGHAAEGTTLAYAVTTHAGTTVSGTGSFSVDDCNDTEDDVYEGHPIDTLYDGTDSDCDDADDYDADGDGYVPAAYSGLATYHSYVDLSSTWLVSGTGALSSGDCFDIDAFGFVATDYYPGAPDTWYDGQDTDCGSDDDYDADADTYVEDGYVGLNTLVATGLAHSATGGNGGECNDDDADFNPGATDTWYDGEDNDCGGEDDYDADTDSYVPLAYSGLVTYTDSSSTNAVSGTGALPTDDCNDGDDAINPAATEVCDASDVDEDCNGVADDDDSGVDTGTQTTYYVDGDTDTYGLDGSDTLFCNAPASGYSLVEADCNDGDPAIHDFATELTGDEVDQNCDDIEICFADIDNDGYSDETLATVESTANTDCNDAGENTSADPQTDCDDDNENINPGETEVCDDSDVDEDCSGAADDDDTGVDVSTLTDWYTDDDGDGYGDEDDLSPSSLCNAPSDTTDENTDCDDGDEDINPGESETLDGKDNDCDESYDEGLITTDSEYVLVTEIMVNPSASIEVKYEWFELYNPNAFDIVLDTNWVFYDGPSSTGFTLTGPLTIASGTYAVLANEDDPTLNGNVTVDEAYGGSGIGAFNNAFDFIEVGYFDPDDLSTDVSDLATAVVVDTVQWTGPTPWPVSNGVSLQLDNDSSTGYPAESNDDPLSWCAATAAWDSGDAGSPGADNEDCP